MDLQYSRPIAIIKSKWFFYLILKNKCQKKEFNQLTIYKLLHPFPILAFMFFGEERYYIT